MNDAERIVSKTAVQFSKEEKIALTNLIARGFLAYLVMEGHLSEQKFREIITEVYPKFIEDTFSRRLS